MYRCSDVYTRRVSYTMQSVQALQVVGFPRNFVQHGFFLPLPQPRGKRVSWAGSGRKQGINGTRRVSKAKPLEKQM